MECDVYIGAYIITPDQKKESKIENNVVYNPRTGEEFGHLLDSRDWFFDPKNGDRLATKEKNLTEEIPIRGWQGYCFEKIGKHNFDDLYYYKFIDVPLNGFSLSQTALIPNLDERELQYSKQIIDVSDFIVDATDDLGKRKEAIDELREVYKDEIKGLSEFYSGIEFRYGVVINYDV